MIYNPTIELERKKAIEKLNFFISKGKTFELKEKKKKRSISQNSYLHLILTFFGLETGYTLDEVKVEVFKKLVNPTIFYDGEKTGAIEGLKIERFRSTSDLSTDEMTLAIDRFRDFSSKEMGIYLPEPKDLASLEQLENEISKHTNKEFI